MLKLFYSPGACSMASHIALEEAGARYERVRVNLAGGEQRGEAYAKINPKGRVPALATDQGVLTETTAILAYVAQTHPQAKIAPLDDPFAFARVQEFNAFLSSTVHVSHAHRVRGSRWSDDPAVIEGLKLKVAQNMTDAFQLIETKMLAGPYVLGDRFTVADGYLFTMARWLEGDSVDIKKFPKVNDHQKRVADRPAVQRILAAEKAAA